MNTSAVNDKILIGEVTSAVGIRGEVKAKCYSSSPERFSWLDFVFCEKSDGTVEKIDIEGAGSKGNMAVIKLAGVDDRNAAEEMRGTKLYIGEDQLEELPEDSYYVRDLIGLNAIDFETGETVGTVSDVLQNTAQDVYVIARENKSSEDRVQDILVPAVKEFIKEINIEDGYMKIRFIEGMI